MKQSWTDKLTAAAIECCDCELQLRKIKSLAKLCDAAESAEPEVGYDGIPLCYYSDEDVEEYCDSCQENYETWTNRVSIAINRRNARRRMLYAFGKLQQEKALKGSKDE